MAVILDEAGAALLDEAGGKIYDELGIPPATPGILAATVAPDGRLSTGQLPRVSVAVRDLDGNLTDPGVLRLVIQKPDGTLLSYASPAADSTGLFHQDVPVTDLGDTGHYAFRWTSGGESSGEAIGSFDVFDPFEIRVLSLQAAKDALNIPQSDTTHDTEIDRLIATIESGLERFTGGPVITRSITERAELDGTLTALLLRQRPVVSVTSIVAVASGQAVDISGGLDVDNVSGVVRTALGWPFVGPYFAFRPAMLVTYQAGWGTAVPAAFAEFAAIVIDHLWQPQRGPAAMPMGGVDTVTPPWLGFAIPNRALELLNGSQDGIPYALEAYI